MTVKNILNNDLCINLHKVTIFSWSILLLIFHYFWIFHVTSAKPDLLWYKCDLYMFPFIVICKIKAASVSILALQLGLWVLRCYYARTFSQSIIFWYHHWIPTLAKATESNHFLAQVPTSYPKQSGTSQLSKSS